MKKYDTDATCIKCGCGDIDDEHVKEQSQAYADALNRNHHARFGIGHPYQPHPEHIERTCRNCEYVWNEAPIDKLKSDIEKDVRDAATRGLGICTEIIWPDGSKTSGTMKHVPDGGHALDAKMLSADKVKFTFMDKSEADEAMDVLRDTLRMPTDAPVIEVGDVVRFNLKCSKAECKVIEMHGNYAALLNISCINKACACSKAILDITFIRKGPKVHTFEGVKVYPGTQVPFINFPKECNSSLDIFAKYTVTVTEEAVK